MVEQYGYIVRQIDNEKTICLNDKKLVSTVEGINRMGVYIKDDKLYYDGILLVQPDSNADTDETISLNTDGTFGGINLDTQGKECINITIADYNKLLHNERVDGYKPYNKYDVYNLVDNVENAEPVYYTETDDGYLFGNILWREKKNVIYNNVVGVLTPSEYSVNFENNLFNTDCPLITISYFNPIIVTGENILLEYRVSDLYDSVLNYDTIGPRYDKDNNIIETGIYKVIIRTEDGDEVTKYTYAGNILIETPTFNVLTPGKDRETWFSVQVIDSRGVASVEHFLNVYVRAEEYQADYLQVTDNLLEDFGITYDGDANDNVSAYKNKQAFSNLFAYAKDMGKNGVELPKHDYYLDYHTNINISTDETVVPDIDLGSQTYYYVELSGGKISKTPEVITLEDIINDTKKIFRYPTGTGFDEIEAIANQVDSNGDSPILYIGDDNWYSIQDKNAIAYLKNNVLYLKTYKKDVMSLYNSNAFLGLDSVLNNRKLYLVHNTAEPTKYNLSMSAASYKKDNMYFPNNFTVDLNGSSFIAAYTDDIQEGSLVNFFDNVDTHVINGKFIGLYSRYDFLKAHINTARNVVGEHMHVCWNYRSKYCSFENLDISGAIGYDCSYDHGGMMGNAATTLTNNTYVNARGIVTRTDEEIITTGSTNITSDYVSLGRTSKNKFVYCGKRHEVFASFYAGNGSFIKTIKSKLYDLIAVPKDINGNRAASVVFTGYGIAKTSTADAKASDWVAAWKDNGNIAAGDPVLAIGCVVKDCFMHDTRTVAIGNPSGRQLLYDNITFTRCATTKYLGISSGGSITPLLGDFEDSWNWGKHICIENCKHVKDSSQRSSSNITIYAGEHIEFKNNDGFSLKFGGMVEGGIIKDNIIRSWLIEKTRSCFHPHIEIKNNNINSLSVYVKPSDDVETHISEETAYDVPGTTEPIVEIDVTQIDTAYNDTIEPVIAMANCVFKKMIKYDYFKLRHCKVDTVAVDYIN